jgi:hypothetical protein
MAETPYADTEALLATMRALQDLGEDDLPDYTEVRAILDDMFPGELRALATAANELRLLAWRRYGEVASLPRDVSRRVHDREVALAAVRDTDGAQDPPATTGKLATVPAAPEE